MVWTLVLASIGTFMSSLDILAVSTALPSIQSGLGASLSDLEWVINAYVLAFACLMLTGSALGDRFGRRRMYVVGLVIFALASIICALSGGIGALIVGRVVQGASAAIVLPLTLTLVSEAFPLEKRAAAIGLWGAMTGLGVALGPLVGGALTQGIGWQAIFWVNVPIGIISAALSRGELRESYGPRPQLDILGLVLVIISMLALTWAPVRAPIIGWNNGEVVTALVLGVVFLIGFLAWQRRATHPMMPLSYFKVRGFSTANGVLFFQQLSLIGSVFLITQMFQVGLGSSPLLAGLQILVWTGMPMVVAPLAGALSEKIGNRPFMGLGLLIQGIGLGWLAAVVEPGVGYGTLVVPLIVAGIGIAMVFPTSAAAVVQAVPINDSGLASGVNNTLRELGGVFGVAILAAVFAANGSYASSAEFISGMKAAEWVAAVLAIVGTVWAIAAPNKAAAFAETVKANPGLVPPSAGSNQTQPEAA
jgi:EmrB/QacA subfamily drug resistance transporter